ncbi:hypothetical protein CALVIDRAFT_343456 [Calocera viscosa TUFC12733]|uniref:Uncharacterized protein n=1 Tax=Calocera viscosa (strain TUFC12733) TaxID=1330018 RepID=A0A167HG12_CALVF|nr:hypothetical protein CALVIDRAFT_343456 [Calocera viscosa TUFC12733]
MRPPPPLHFQALSLLSRRNQSFYPFPCSVASTRVSSRPQPCCVSLGRARVDRGSRLLPIKPLQWLPFALRSSCYRPLRKELDD